MKQDNNIPIYIAISIVFGIVLGSFFNIRNTGETYAFNKSNQTENEKINAVLNFIKNEYVDDVKTDEIIDDMIQGIVDRLDPHSSYLPKELQQYAQETMEGNFEGIGVQFIQKSDTVVVVKVLPDGPSKKAGLKAGDRLLLANKDTLYGKNLSSDKIVTKLKGPANTQVNVKVFRPGAKNLINFKITRSKVAIKSIPVTCMLNDSIAYIKLLRFSMTSYDELKGPLAHFKKKGVKNLVLDLRGNPGGFMHIADQIADEFLTDGQLIVYTKSKKGKRTNSVATAGGSFEKGNVFVLVDENSASASEIIAGAIQDNDRGTIIGRRTFGKGLVQQEIDFNDGSALRLTTARYYTPTGRSIQKPYQKNQNKNYEEEVTNRYESGELFFKDSIKVNPKLRFKTPKGKVVYGGGGIVPDEFIPLEQANLATYLEFNLISDFTFNYIDKNRKALSVYTFQNFEKQFVIDAALWKAFVNYAKPYQFKNINLTKAMLKESFAETLFGEEMYYKLILARDPYIFKVNQLLAKPKKVGKN